MMLVAFLPVNIQLYLTNKLSLKSSSTIHQIYQQPFCMEKKKAKHTFFCHHNIANVNSKFCF